MVCNEKKDCADGSDEDIKICQVCILVINLFNRILIIKCCPLTIVLLFEILI